MGFDSTNPTTRFPKKDKMQTKMFDPFAISGKGGFYIGQAHWSDMDDPQRELFVEQIIRHYRTNGFPHYAMPLVERQREFAKLCRANFDSLVSGQIIKQTMAGLGLAWHYFPHAWEVKCNGLLTPMEVFSSDELFRKALRKRLTWGTYISDSGIRKALKTFSGAQAVSNFRPTAAAAIYRHLGGRVVWDMSCGFGGRLLGALASGYVQKYIGTEPSGKTYDALLEIKRDFYNSVAVELHQCGSEDYRPEPESLDLCFTSPPYFDCEKYSDEITQSYIKFPGKELWLRSFMGETIANCHAGLRRSGLLALNIAPVKSYPEVVDDVKALAISIGFKHQRTMQLELSRMMGTKQKGAYKYEPILVFEK